MNNISFFRSVKLSKSLEIVKQFLNYRFIQCIDTKKTCGLLLVKFLPHKTQLFCL